MKKLLFLVLIFALTACAAPTTPVAQPPAPTQPPVVVEVTVVVPATAAPEAAPTDVPPTAAPAATEAPAAAPTEAPAAAPTPTSPPAVGGDQLVNITRSGDAFSLRCSPSEITFTATSASPYIVDVEIWYRMVDKVTGVTSQWYSGGKMESDGKGNFTRVFSALDINPDVRSREAGWFEYQFVTLAKDGNVVWRSDKATYAQQVTYTKECP